MAKANFPASPTNGQTVVIGGITYIYNSSKGIWRDQISNIGNTSDTPPANAVDGQLWYNSSNGGLEFLDQQVQQVHLVPLVHLVLQPHMQTSLHFLVLETLLVISVLLQTLRQSMFGMVLNGIEYTVAHKRWLNGQLHLIHLIIS